MLFKKSFLFLLVCFFGSVLHANGFDWCFIPNNGQNVDHVNFSHTLPNGVLFLENDRLTYHLYDVNSLNESFENHHKKPEIQHHAFNVVFENANPNLSISQEEPTEYYFNYFVGNDQSKWASNVKGYNQVKYSNIYSGIDFVMYHSGASIKYDFIVGAGSDPNQISLSYEGLSNIFIDNNGRLHLINDVEEIIEDRPITYQVINGQRTEIASKYSLKNKTLSFEFPNGYNPDHDIIIDPTLIFSSYSGATQVYGANCSAFDGAGNFYSSGNTPFGGYPTSIGSYQAVWTGVTPAAIQKFDQAGNMLYATYLGGDFEHPLEMVVNANNELVVLINTSGNFPMTGGAANSVFGGLTDYAVGILNNGGTNLIASTYVGGTGDEGVNNYDIAGGLFIDNNGDILISGMSNSIDYPTTAGAFQVVQPGNESGVVTKLNAGLTNVIWSTYVGGAAGNDIVNSISIAPSGDVYGVGNTTSADFPASVGALNPFPLGLRDGFVICLNPTGSNLNAATFLGTGADDRAKFIQINAANEIFVGGSSNGLYPISAGVFSSPSNNNLFVHKLNTSLNASFYSTSIGCFDNAAPEIYMTAFGIDYCGKVYFSGASTGNNFPITADAYSANEQGLYMCVLDPDAVALDYGTYFGGNDNAQHIHPASKSVYTNEGILYHTECTQSSNYPLLNGTGTQNGIFQDGALFIFDFEFSLPLTQINLGAPINTCTLPVNLDAFDANNLNVEYLWSTGAITDNIDVNLSGSYSVMVYNTCDTIHDTIDVNISSITADFSVLQSDRCLGETFTFTDLTAAVGPNQSWSWDFGDGRVSTTQNPIHEYNSVGTYTVTLTVADGACTDMHSLTVTVNPVPTADFDFSPQFLTVENNEIQFTNLSTNGDSYVWNFGSSFGSTVAENPSFTFPEESEITYPIILEVTNIHGCRDQIIKYLEFQDDIIFYVPNAFTPGTSGPNSMFEPVMTSGIEPYQYHFLIFNRWGDIVFESYNSDKGWDGKYDNHIVQPGTYVWQIEFRETMSDKKHTQRGHVTVVR